jgi:hypothetical protein
MGVALMVVPGIVAAWLWLAPAARGWIVSLRQLLAGGAAMIAVGLAWPVLVWLTPAADRPWVSGTSDNSIWSLILNYNGLGRLDGQTGGPGGGAGGGGSMFGGPTGPFRLLESSLGDQAGWLLGFAVVVGLALVVRSRLRRDDQRTGWVLVIGGAFATTAVAFSFASGIFHPYYVSLLAPFAAALIGAGVGMMLDGPSARVIGPLAIIAGAITELVVLGELGGQLAWAKPVVIVFAAASAGVLALRLSPRTRMVLVAVAVAALLAAPATWAAETLGHATSSTFPTGGPASAVALGGGGPGGGAGGSGRPGGIGQPGGSGPGGSGQTGGFPGGGTRGFAAPPSTQGTTGSGAPPSGAGGATSGGGTAGPGSATSGGATAGPGGFGGEDSTLTAAIRYAKAHGGGTIGVSSQGSAAAAILSSDANVAGLGGFSGRESSVSVRWLAAEVKAGRLRWVIADSNQGMRLPGDTRTGSQTAISAVAASCKAVSLNTGSGSATMYDCSGRAAAILQAARSTGN